MNFPFSKRTIVSLSSLAFVVYTNNASAVVVTQWNFNSSTPDASNSTGTTTPSLGSGIASLVGGVSSGFASGTGSSDPDSADDTAWSTAAYSPQGTEDKARGVEFRVSTLGFDSLTINYDLRHSNTSSRYEQFQYSLDGTNFIDFALFEGNTGDTWFNNRTVDLTGLSGANNNANFAFRIVSTFEPGGSVYVASNDASNYGTSGTWRFDMVTVNAVPVPEAKTFAMMLAGLGLVGWRMHRRRH